MKLPGTGCRESIDMLLVLSESKLDVPWEPGGDSELL